MNTALWVMQGILAVFFLMPGFMKLTTPKQKFVDAGQIKPEDSALPFRILGALEVLGSVGIIVPWLTGVCAVLTPITAVCFCIVMLGAIPLHIKKNDYKIIPVLVLALILSGVVAYYRFAAGTV